MNITTNYSLSNNYALNKKRVMSQPETVNASSDIAFKANKESAFGKWIGKMYGKYYGKPMYDKKWIQTASEKMTKFPGSMTEHMATLGSVLTSSVYMYKTVTNKDLDSDKRKTLAINQGLCCIIPAIGAYTISNKMANFKKNIEYKYRGLKEQQVALGQISKEEAKALQSSLGSKLKGLNALTGLITFTLIYRYLTPVVVTPIANKIGNFLNGKAQKAQEVELKPNVEDEKAGKAA